MQRILIAFAVTLLFCGCPPSRGSDEPDEPSGPGSVWLEVTSVQGGEESVSHNFLQWNGGSGLCAAVQAYYTDYTDASIAYYEGSAALDEQWGDVEDAEQNPEYRRDYCELMRAYYGLYYSSSSIFSAGRTLTTLSLGHPDSSNGEPIEGTYLLDSGDEPLEQRDGEGWFHAYRTVYLQDYYQDVADSIDCDAYASDPDAELIPQPDEPEDPQEVTEEYTLTAGTLEATPESDSSWRLTVTDGVEFNYGTEEETEFTLDSVFPHCAASVDYSGLAQ